MKGTFLISLLFIGNQCLAQSQEFIDNHEFLNEYDCEYQAFFENASFEESVGDYWSIEDMIEMGTFIPFWTDCGFDGESPPTRHLDGREMFNVKKYAYDGFAFISMVVRETDTWERMSQELDRELVAGQSYIFGLYACCSKELRSNVVDTNNPFENRSFGNPVKLRLWGGTGPCQRQELLYESEVISNVEWRELVIKFKPNKKIDYLTLEAYYGREISGAYNGNILIDYISDIYLVKQ